MVFAARGITQRDRHLMVDLRDMMPQSKTENKFERKDPLFVINEVKLQIKPSSQISTCLNPNYSSDL